MGCPGGYEFGEVFCVRLQLLFWIAPKALHFMITYSFILQKTLNYVPNLTKCWLTLPCISWINARSSCWVFGVYYKLTLLLFANVFLFHKTCRNYDFFCIAVFNNTPWTLWQTKFPHLCATFRNFFAFLNKFGGHIYLSDLRTGGRRTSTAQRMRLAVIPAHPQRGRAFI